MEKMQELTGQMSLYLKLTDFGLAAFCKEDEVSRRPREMSGTPHLTRSPRPFPFG